MKKLFYLLLLFGVTVVQAQDDKAALQKFMHEDSIDVNTIAVYPENIRSNIFDATLQPQAIARLGYLQK